MEIETFTHRLGAGWSGKLPSRLDSGRTLVVAFGAPEYAEHGDALAELAAAFPRSAVVGCSTAGQIHGDAIADGSLVVAVARFSRTDLAVASTAIDSIGDSASAGARLGRTLAAARPRLVLVLSEGLTVNGTELVRGLHDSLPRDSIIVGGLAADGDRFARTWVLVDSKPAVRHVVAVALRGPLEIGASSQGGWDAFGPERKVTRAAGNVLYELDGKPALALYKEYLGDLASGLPASALRFPLSIREERSAETAVVRTVLAIDESAQSMTFAGDLPTGWHAQLMRSNHDRLIAGAMRAAAAATAGMTRDEPALALAISCVGRRLVLGDRSEEETEAALEALPPGSRQIGFYSYGEISPASRGGCELHNQTMTLTTIREASA
jgi:hypothetical protein